MLLQPTRQETDEMIFQAGIGTAQLSRLGLLVARFYHWIIAAFTITIVMLAALPSMTAPSVALWLALYLTYFAARKLMNETWRQVFYRPEVQFVRAQIGVIAVALLIYFSGPSAQQASLWLLFVLVLQLVSKHCSTSSFLICLVEVWAVLIVVRGVQVGQMAGLEVLIVQNLDVVAQCLWIGLLAFVIHYLVRNIDARQETISGYELVDALSGRLETLTDAQAKWEAVLDTCLKVVQGQSATLWMCDHKTQELRLFAQSTARRAEPKASLSDGETIPISLSLTEHHVLALVARQGSPCYYVVATQIGSCKDGEKMQLPRPPGFKMVNSLMVIPITEDPEVQAKTIALLCIGYDRAPQPRGVIGDYQSLLTNMVVRIRPLFRYEQNLLELAALQEISRQVSMGVDLEHVLDSILDATVTRLGFEFAVVSLVEPDRGIIRALKGVNVPGSWIRRATFPLNGANIRADIVRTGELEIVDGWDERLDQRLWKKHSQHNMVRVFAPITIVDQATQQERTIGVVEAGCRKIHRPTLDDQQVAMLRSFVNQAAVAIEKAHLFDRMEEKTEILTSLHSVGQAIAAARDLPSVWEEIASSAQRILRADIVMLYPYQEEEHRLLTPHVRGTLYGRQPPDYMLKESGVLAKIIRDKSAYYASDALRDPYLNPVVADVVLKTSEAKHRSFTQRQNIRSFAGLPLLAGGHIVGIMCVNYRRRHLFADDEQQILELFAQQAAIAMKNAAINALERQITADEERSRLSRELHESVSQYLPAIKFMASTAREQLGCCQEETAAWLVKIQSAAQAVLNDVEFNLFQLKPVTLEHGLVATVETDIQFLRGCFGSNITLTNKVAETLDATVQDEVFMVVREAITNAARHAHASHVQVRLTTRNGRLYFLVRDDGCGFDPQHLSPKPHHGLHNMRARMALIGGSLHIRSAPGAGTIIRGRVCSRSDNHGLR